MSLCRLTAPSNYGIFTQLFCDGGIAQLVEHRNHNPPVGGSSPSPATILNNRTVGNVRGSIFFVSLTEPLRHKEKKFDDGSRRRVDLAPYLDGEMFEPLREIGLFRTARLDADIDTVVWGNGADMSPDFLYEIGDPIEGAPIKKVAEERTLYGFAKDGKNTVVKYRA